VLGLLLPVREDLYAVELRAVQRVLGLEAAAGLAPLPGAHRAVLGVINVRGQVVPVLDTAALLDLPPLAPSEHGALAVVRVARGIAALVTSAMPFAQELEEALGASSLATATGRRRAGDHVSTVLDLELTLAPERVAR
jgi:purine-binding chemotaxis protein CheW